MKYVYAKIVGSEVSYYPSSLEYLVTQNILDTNTPTDEQLTAANIVKIKQIATIAAIDGHKYTTKPVQQLDGSWAEEWVSIETSEEYASNVDIYSQLMLQERNIRLKYTDWTQLPDVPQATRESWVAYRQALRDVPTQAGFPFSIQWPQPPNR